MQKFLNMKRPRLATILSALALFIVIGGTATAASKIINGKNIKKGTVTAKQIKNKTITTGKLAPATVEALKGAQGPRGEKGEAGAKGATGAQGVQGPPGVSGFTTYSFSETKSNQPANVENEIASANGLPAKRYMITANVQSFSVTPGTIICAINAGNGGGGVEGRWTAPANNSRNVIPLQLITDTTGVTNYSIDCESTTVNSGYTAHVTAIPVS